MFHEWKNGNHCYLSLIFMIKQENAKSVQIQGVATIYSIRFVQ